MTGEDKPCCSAGALRRIRQIEIDGHRIGLAMLDPLLEETIRLELPGEGSVGDELLTRVKIYNYIPPGAEEIYRKALLAEYRRWVTAHGND
jgi:hypothetical protein